MAGLQLVLILIALALTLSRTSAYMFELPDKQEMCFYEDFEEGDDYNMEYKVIRGGKHDVDVTLSSPNGKSIYKKNKKKQDKFSFETSRGKWSLCFGNVFSTVTHKLVYFDLKPANPETQRTKLGKKEATVATKSEAFMENIYQHNQRAVHYQTDYRTNEARGRFTAEELNYRILWWSLFESIVILCSGVGQVLILRAFFTDVRPSKHRAQDKIGAMTPPMSMPVNKI